MNHVFHALTIFKTFETLCFMTQAQFDVSVQTAIADNYSELSGALRAAADFVANNRFDVATRSLRSMASESGLSPTSFSRMARAIGYRDYEELRDNAREEIANDSNRYTRKAKQLHDDADQPFLPRQVQACISNIDALLTENNVADLEAAVDTLEQAQNVTIIGALGSAGFADYFAYLTSWFDGRWDVAGRNGVTLASSLMRMTSDDAVIVISKAPYAKRSVLATEIAAERGVKIITLTDSYTFPGLKHSTHTFIQRVESPQFFPSYAATLVLIETITGMLMARRGEPAVDEIQSVAEQNNRLDEFSSYV